jgi:putative transposase
MPRHARIAPGGWIFHVLNRGNDRRKIFDSPQCYDEFLEILELNRLRCDMRVLAYCLMPNHWHMLLWPRQDHDLSRFLHRTTSTHSRRWHSRHHVTGLGHLYQGRFKSFPVGEDAYLWTVCRYIERNALRANLVTRAAEWKWSSLPYRTQLPAHAAPVTLATFPQGLPINWEALVDQPQTDEELVALRKAIALARPYGSPSWQTRAAESLGMPPIARSVGRPRGSASPSADN